ncbi:hypothetical protein NVP2275O_112 [Vibrio phage 2.275.O._10N.286.54.E11]|nr:hypothetical protein NVP2275O_112 [Vibrio phage 2.275.O._10N.286.54.E11]
MLRVTLLDLVTRQVAVYPDTDLSTDVWTTGNLSCDCNRTKAFPGLVDEMSDTFGDTKCYGTERLVVINVSGDDMSTYDDRSDFIDACNLGYSIPDEVDYPLYSSLGIVDKLQECDCSCHNIEPNHLHGEEPCCGFSGMTALQAIDALRETGQFIEPEVITLPDAAFEQLINAIENPKEPTEDMKKLMRAGERYAATVNTSGFEGSILKTGEHYKQSHHKPQPIPEDLDLEWENKGCGNCDTCTCGEVPEMDDTAIITAMLDDVNNSSVSELQKILEENADGPIARAINPEGFGEKK